jgi:putative addiction module component (TIGR02574 family)
LDSVVEKVKFFSMSKSEILQELPKLKAEERREIFERICEMEELALLHGAEPSAEEKALLDREMEEYRNNPGSGSSWAEVEARLRKPRS